MLDARTQLEAMLRPAAGGLYVVSTGRAAQLEVQRHLYGTADEAEIQARFVAALDRIAQARAIILGVPSDVGAGYRRGANLGPQAIRTALIAADGDLAGWYERRGIVDIGDVAVVPQLLHDDMLAPAQIEASRAALYKGVAPAIASGLPVSPLSIEARVLDLVLTLNPRIVPIVLGGDHSVAWPVAEVLAKHRRDRWSIVQPDAHTDLLAERLGIKYCFATWSYHANELLGRDGRLVQVGVRASRFGREHWESTLGVRQLWAEDILRDPEAALDEVIAHLRRLGVTSVYFSNDIDGTDASFAQATGTPEPDGLSPEWLLALIERLGKEIGICAADCVEVAPPLGPTAEATDATTRLAARYVRACLEQVR
jgi:arginase family enzyme